MNETCSTTGGCALPIGHGDAEAEKQMAALAKALAHPASTYIGILFNVRKSAVV